MSAGRAVPGRPASECALPTQTRRAGFHPLGVWCDETGEALAAVLRPGNAGANTAADHVKMLDAALAQLPAAWRTGHRIGDDRLDVVHPIVVRADSAGATHGFVDALVERNIGFSIGFDVDGRVSDALMLAQEEDWVPAVEGDGSRRPGAWVTELTALADLATWPAGTRLICRRERPHPGAQLSLFDIGTGFRHTCFLTASAGEAAPLELRQRRHARVEDRIRGAKACGLRNFPFEDFVRNEAWLVLVLIAQDLLAWTARICLDGALARAEPATVRYQLLHVGARLARRGRDVHLRIDSAWPWRNPLDGRLRPHARRPLLSDLLGMRWPRSFIEAQHPNHVPEPLVERGPASAATRRGRQPVAMRRVPRPLCRRTNNRLGLRIAWVVTTAFEDQQVLIGGDRLAE